MKDALIGLALYQPSHQDSKDMPLCMAHIWERSGIPPKINKQAGRITRVRYVDEYGLNHDLRFAPARRENIQGYNPHYIVLSAHVPQDPELMAEIQHRLAVTMGTFAIF